MKKTKLLLLFIFITSTIFTSEIYAQEENKKEESPVEQRRKKVKADRAKSSTLYREFGFNTVTILQTVPILPTLDDNPFPTYTFFYKKKRNNKNSVFRFHAGGSLGGIEFRITSFELKVGMEYPKKIVDKWEYYYGYDFLTFVSESGAGAGVGVGPIFGFKYLLNDFMTIGTEGSGYLTLSGGNISGAAINMRPLNGLFLSFKLYK